MGPGGAPVTKLAPLLDLAEDLAAEAAGLSLERLGEPRSRVRTKSSATDMVSEVDEACERLIVDGHPSARDPATGSSPRRARARDDHRRPLGDRPDRRDHELPLRPPGLRDLDRGRGRRRDRRGGRARPDPRRALRRRPRRRGDAQRRADPGLGRDRPRLGADRHGLRLRAGRAGRPGRVARRRDRLDPRHPPHGRRRRRPLLGGLRSRRRLLRARPQAAGTWPRGR